jgi:hypothetical protein
MIHEEPSQLLGFVKDQIYGYIRLTETERKVLDAGPVQRLRRIKQLYGAEYVYPAATCTRFEHALGTMICLGAKRFKDAAHDLNHAAIRLSELGMITHSSRLSIRRTSVSRGCFPLTRASLIIGITSDRISGSVISIRLTYTSGTHVGSQLSYVC